MFRACSLAGKIIDSPAGASARALTRSWRQIDVRHILPLMAAEPEPKRTASTTQIKSTGRRDENSATARRTGKFSDAIPNGTV